MGLNCFSLSYCIVIFYKPPSGSFQTEKGGIGPGHSGRDYWNICEGGRCPLVPSVAMALDILLFTYTPYLHSNHVNADKYLDFAKHTFQQALWGNDFVLSKYT